MYKGYSVREVVLHDYETPETAVIIDAPAGCSQCQDEGQVQPGHSLCALIPDELAGDENIYPSLDSTHGWIMYFSGPDEHVDEWLEAPKELPME
jgi:hypothetical protein